VESQWEVKQPLIVSLAPKARASSNDLYNWIQYAETGQFLYEFFSFHFILIYIQSYKVKVIITPSIASRAGHNHVVISRLQGPSRLDNQIPLTSVPSHDLESFLLRGESTMVHLGDLVACMNLSRQVNIMLLLIDVVLLQELGALDLVCLEQLEISL
jgi:hypothetical protein